MDNAATEATTRITQALLTDFAERFKRAYGDKDSEEVAVFKRRMYMGLKGLDIESSLSAYQRLVEEKPEFMPTLQAIISRAKSIFAKTKREQEELIERERVAALPPPSYNVDSMALLAEAKNQPSEISTEELIARHNALIAKDKRLGFIRTPPRLDNGKCAVSHCRMAGGLTTSLKGSDRFYCKEHFQA